jgi:hypothetical protein
MKSAIYKLAFDGGLLTRGLWLYVLEITRRDSSRFYYVGRTGDSSSSNPQSLFNRVSQHFGSNRRNNTPRRHLTEWSIEPEECSFQLVAYGPMLAKVPKPYTKRRDIIAALEKALADAMSAAGYTVINTISCRKPEQAKRFVAVRAAFAAAFPKLQRCGA